MWVHMYLTLSHHYYPQNVLSLLGLACTIGLLSSRRRLQSFVVAVRRTFLKRDGKSSALSCGLYPSHLNRAFNTTSSPSRPVEEQSKKWVLQKHFFLNADRYKLYPSNQNSPFGITRSSSCTDHKSKRKALMKESHQKCCASATWTVLSTTRVAPCVLMISQKEKLCWRKVIHCVVPQHFAQHL